LSKKTVFWVAGLATLVSLAWWFTRQSAPSAPAAAPPAAPAVAARPALTVAVGRPESLSLPVTLAANGNIAAWQEAIIGSESNGLRLQELRVGVGDVVRAGQVLAVFASESVQADVAQAQAALLEAQATAAEAQANAQRARSLQDSGALSDQQINQYLTAAQTAQARVEAARAVLAAQQLRGRQAQVVAPAAGVISARLATLGAVASPGAELFRLIRDGRLEWRAEVTSTELARLKLGTPVTLTTATGAQLQGRVRMLAPTVDPQTRSALVYVDLPPMQQTPGGARPGMFARGEFRLGESSALTVPQRALVVRDGFEFVFQWLPGDKVGELKVQTGRRVGERVEIVSGLSPEARVVTQGAGFLNDGDVVRVADGTVPAPADAPTQR
jgi:RND family efflux transporter MFP subunit